MKWSVLFVTLATAAPIPFRKSLHQQALAAAASQKPKPSSNWVHGMIRCTSDECRVICGEHGDKMCFASLRTNGCRAKMHSFWLECADLQCSLRCTRYSAWCPIFGTLRYSMPVADTYELSFDNTLDYAAKVATDVWAGLL